MIAAVDYNTHTCTVSAQKASVARSLLKELLGFLFEGWVRGGQWIRRFLRLQGIQVRLEQWYASSVLHIP